MYLPFFFTFIKIMYNNYTYFLSMDVKLEKWHKCQIDKEVLKELSKKSDLKGLQHVSVFFGLLLITGIFAYQTWGTWWSVFWFLVYGNIYSFSNPLWHETGHKTAFQSKFLNELFYYISSCLLYTSDAADE